MDIKGEPELREFRLTAREWLADNTPRSPRPRESSQVREFDAAWQRCQYDGGWAGLDWPVEYGGRGMSPIRCLIWAEECLRAGAPGSGVLGTGLRHAGPTLVAWGTPEQKDHHLASILRGEHAWCQGFSEPNAGSDLGSLRTSAVVDGEELVVNGQKIWTSNAQWADYQELLVRTDPGAPRHQGISWVICDMRATGVEVRPIKTIDGREPFCEVFYTDVRIPLSNIVGKLDQGWKVAMSTLAIERGPSVLRERLEVAVIVERLVELAADRGVLHAAGISEQLAMARARAASVQAMAYMNISRAESGLPPGPEGSLLKLQASELFQLVCRLAMDILGPDALVLGDLVERWLHSFALTIQGGTKDIQRNVVAERLLGLPR